MITSMKAVFVLLVACVTRIGAEIVVITDPVPETRRDITIEARILDDLTSALRIRGLDVVSRVGSTEQYVMVEARYSKRLIGSSTVLIQANYEPTGQILALESGDFQTNFRELVAVFVNSLFLSLTEDGIGTVTITTIPDSEISIDGNMIGTSPQQFVELSVGEHIIGGFVKQDRFSEIPINVVEGKHQEIVIRIPRKATFVVELAASPFIIQNIPKWAVSSQLAYIVSPRVHMGLFVSIHTDSFIGSYIYPIGIEFENPIPQERRNIGFGLGGTYFIGDKIILPRIGARIGAMSAFEETNWMVIGSAEVGVQFNIAGLFSFFVSASGFVASPQEFVGNVEVLLFENPVQTDVRLWSYGLSLTTGLGLNL